MTSDLPSRNSLTKISVPEPVNARVRALLARAVVRRAQRRLAFRVVTADEPGARVAPDATAPSMILQRPETFYRRVGTDGIIGFGEAFQSGDWDSDDLPGLLTVFASGLNAFIPEWLQSIRGHRVAPRRPCTDDQTIDGARNNARHHYALPNDLFLAFLDETMCYSSAIFRVDDNADLLAGQHYLADAQRRKIDRLLDAVGVRDGTSLLEIGTGWGELSVRAARRGAHVHTVTNMPEHVAAAESRLTQASVIDRVRVELADYRQLAPDFRDYDAIVSVEMIEAVGQRYWPTYFQILEDRLGPQGLIGLQMMTMSHDRLMKSSNTYTWIDKYIFPGGLLPSLPAIETTVARHTRLRILDRYSFGKHYAATLAIWRERFNQNWRAVEKLGFDEVFRRTWNFYLAQSEAGFASGYLDVHQLVLGR